MALVQSSGLARGCGRRPSRSLSRGPVDLNSFRRVGCDETAATGLSGTVALPLANWSGPILFKAIRYKHIGIMIGAIIAQINANLLAPLDCTLIRKKGFFIGHLVI